MKRKIVNSIFLLLLLWVTIVSAQVINAGVGGNNSINLLERLDVDVLQQAPNLVILLVGTNDMLNTKKMISYRDYEENLKKIIQKIKQRGAEIIIMTPPPVDSVYLFNRHDRKAYKEVPNVKLDSTRLIIKNLTEINSLGYIDLFQIFSDMSLPIHNKDLFFRNERNSNVKDGVHPTSLGYRFIAETVFDYLKNNQFLNKDQKIICFGDSITNGAGTKHSGTNTGENYPAVLSRLIAAYFQEN